MKIFFIIRGLHDVGGIERVTTIVANGLAERNYEIRIVCFEKDEPYFKLHPNIKIHYINSLLFKKRELKKLYKNEKPDINIFLGSHRSLINIPPSKGIPCITWEHFNAKINWHPLHKYSKKLAVKYCNKIVVLTNTDVKNYKNIFNANNVTCIPNPLTLNKIEETTLSNKTLLAVGRLASQKGFDLLIDAWARTKTKNLGWNLKIVGNGRHLSKLLKQISKNNLQNSIEIVPPTKNIISEYKNASALVMSSRFEGLPLVLIEAMSAGLPIVSFDCETGPREIVIHNETGLLVPPLNVNELAKAIDNLLLNESKLKEFSKNSLLKSKKFSINNILNQWEKLFKEIMENK